MINPYLNFNGNAAEAIAFYEGVFDCADKKVMRFSDTPPNPDFQPDPAQADEILHASMTVEGTTVFFSDTRVDIAPGMMVSLSVGMDSAEKVRRAYDAILAGGGEALMAIGPQFFAKMYAWVRDKYGVDWQLIYD